jgi:hypothetical protein
MNKSRRIVITDIEGNTTIETYNLNNETKEWIKLDDISMKDSLFIERILHKSRFIIRKNNIDKMKRGI